MDTKKKRFMVTIPSDVAIDVADVKQNLFHDKPYSEMYRELIRAGLDALKAEKSAKTVQEEKTENTCVFTDTDEAVRGTSGE